MPKPRRVRSARGGSSLREIWAPAWFATALCAIVLVATSFRNFETVAPAFFSFLPVVFFQMARTIQRLSHRVQELESASRAMDET